MANQNTVNILLLGETGVGKSTFINALVNYLSYDSLNEASNHELLYLIPTKFTMTDDALHEKTITIGNSPNESHEPGSSATRNPMSYLIDINEVTIRIIDTPGLGDTRGMSFDEINSDKVLQYISELGHLNAICIMLKPNNSRLDVLFEYCIKHILARLDKRVQNNIIFLFTNARSSFYKPGDTLPPLRKMLQKIASNPPYATVPLYAENTFCIDNESFRFLVANSKGIKFDENERIDYEKSWTQSVNTCKRMLNYIMGLQPAQMHGTVTINEARRIIVRLAQPVGEMAVLFNRTIRQLQDHEERLLASQNSIDKLKDELSITVTEFRVAQKKNLESTSTSHGATAGVGLLPVPPYASLNIGYQYQTSTVRQTEEIIEPYERTVEDPNVKKQLIANKNVVEIATDKINEINQLRDEYAIEADVILNAAVNFSVFFKENAIVAYQDAFQSYFEELLKRERKDEAHSNMVKMLEDLLINYQRKKREIYNVTSQEIIDIMDALFNLKHSGSKIKYFYDKLHVFEDGGVYSVPKN